MDKPAPKNQEAGGLNSTALIKRVGIAILLLAALYAVYFPLSAVIQNTFTGVTNSWLDSNINNTTGLNRNIKAEKSPDKNYEVNFITYYFDLQDSSGNIPAKTIAVDVRREYYMPFIIFLALMLVTPVPPRKKIIMIAIGTGVMLIYLYLKFYIMIFDNYNTPDYAIMHLTGFKNFFVYHGAQFLALTGSSTVAIIPVVIWLALSVNVIFGYIKK